MALPYGSVLWEVKLSQKLIMRRMFEFSSLDTPGEPRDLKDVFIQLLSCGLVHLEGLGTQLLSNSADRVSEHLESSFPKTKLFKLHAFLI